MITLRNEYLEISIAEQGAEMQHLLDVKTGREYLWQGDATYWNGRAPILFPVVGGLWNGTYRYDGREYEMPKHGFARRSTWQAGEIETSATEQRVVYTLDLPQGRDNFPFPCRVEVIYILKGRTVAARFRVHNCGEGEMFFQMGGHPAMNLPGWDPERPVGGYLGLEGVDVASAGVVRAGAQGCTGPERYGVPCEDGLIPVSEATFLHEALIFDGGQIKSATLFDMERNPVVRLRSTAPAWLFWQPQGLFSPFVCIEPWYGLCDRQGFAGDVSERPYMNRLAAGAVWEGGYELEIL